MSSSFEAGKRVKILNLIKAAFEAKPVFKKVELSPPSSPMPSAILMPAIFITRATESIEQLTNLQKTSTFPLEVVGFCQADKDLELKKAELEDEIESVFNELQQSQSFTDLAVQVKVIQADGGPLALMSLGLNEGTFPPFGSIRVSVQVIFDYNAIC